MTIPRFDPDHSPVTQDGIPNADRIHAFLPWLFLLYALPAILFLSVIMPPFQVADELNHALRADQIVLGAPIPDPINGRVHSSLIAFGALYESMWFHPEVKQTIELARQAGKIDWSASISTTNFQNTVQYGPSLYLPQAAAFRLGQSAGLSLAQTLVVARLANGIAACLAAFFALYICRRGNALMFATLLLPMTLSEFASVSQDALIIGLSLLAIAVASRVLTEGRIAGTGEFSLFAAVVAATTMARPSQFALGLLAPAFINWRDMHWRAKAAVFACAAFLIGGWMVLLRTLMPPPAPEWSPSGQFEYVLTHPFALPIAMANTFAADGRWLVGTVVGRLGWLDAPMSNRFVAMACFVLLLAALASNNRPPTLRPALIAATTFLALLTATCFALYLTWTPLRNSTVNGLQGRYVLPVLPLLAWLVPTFGPRLQRSLTPIWWPVLLFPLVTLFVLPRVIMERYYGSWTVMAESLAALLVPS